MPTALACRSPPLRSTPSPPGASAVWPCVMAAVAVAVCARWYPARARAAALAVVAWMALTAGAALSGRLARFDVAPPPMAILIVAVFALAFAIGLGSAGARLAAAVPLATLVGLQAFRLPLELVMHRAATLGIMPPEMSYSGYNLDIVTGAGGARPGAAAARRRGGAAAGDLDLEHLGAVVPGRDRRRRGGQLADGARVRRRSPAREHLGAVSSRTSGCRRCSSPWRSPDISSSRGRCWAARRPPA